VPIYLKNIAKDIISKQEKQICLFVYNLPNKHKYLWIPGFLGKGVNSKLQFYNFQKEDWLLFSST
jgi:hypothetical protein